jgi:hypothetical protein
LKSIEIINYIDSIINEDAYSRYKVEQIYQKLGHDGFMEYIEGLLTRAVAHLSNEFGGNNYKIEFTEDFIIRHKTTKPETGFYDVFFVGVDQSPSSSQETRIMVKYWFGNEKEGAATDSSSLISIDGQAKDLTSQLNKTLNWVFFNNETQKRRTSYLNGLILKSTPVKIEDYHKYRKIEDIIRDKYIIEKLKCQIKMSKIF